MAKQATGNQDPNLEQDEGTSSEKFVTSEQVAQIVNSAITARNRAFESKLESQFSELKQLFSKTDETQSEIKAKKVNPELEAMQNKLKVLEGERSKARDMQLRTAVKEQLLKAGVNPAAVKALVAMHVDADKTIGYANEENDEILFKGNDSHYTLEQGLGNWLQSEDAKIYLTPRGTAGSGDKTYNNSNKFSGKSNTPSRKDVGNMLVSAFAGLPSSDEE